MFAHGLKERDEAADRESNRTRLLRRTRDEAMLLIGFWRGFRADELTSLYFEHMTIREGGLFPVAGQPAGSNAAANAALVIFGFWPKIQRGAR